MTSFLNGNAKDQLPDQGQCTGPLASPSKFKAPLPCKLCLTLPFSVQVMHHLSFVSKNCALCCLIPSLSCNWNHVFSLARQVVPFVGNWCLALPSAHQVFPSAP